MTLLRFGQIEIVAEKSQHVAPEREFSSGAFCSGRLGKGHGGQQ
jgi:hypothetical protein